MRRINEEKKAMIKELLELKYDYKSISDKVGVCEGTVARYKKLLNKECGIEASNRWNGGKVSSNIIPKNFKEESSEELNQKDLTENFIIDVERSINMRGGKTGFGYNYSTKSEILKIKTYNKDPIELDLGDILSFANELFDIANELEKFRK